MLHCMPADWLSGWLLFPVSNDDDDNNNNNNNNVDNFWHAVTWVDSQYKGTAYLEDNLDLVNGVEMCL